MMRLKYLRKRLAALRRRRQWFRWSTAWIAAAIAVLWALAGIFALDWLFQRNEDIVQRLFLIALGAAAVVWAFVRYARPWLGRHEDDLQMALLVQHQSGIDTDLVAALQFESSEAATWGSTQLETAVIDRVAANQRNLNVMASLPREPLAYRRKVLLATAVVLATLGLIVPGHFRTFFHRLLLGSQHYPTQTRIASMSINGKSIELALHAPTVVHVGYGRQVRFNVQSEGARPAGGRVELTGAGRGPAAVVPLESAGTGDDGGDTGVFQGDYARILQPMRCQIYLGDAWTDPLSLEVSPLPVIEVEPEVVPPIYARRTPDEVVKIARGMRQFTVLEGSEVRMKLRSSRPLKSATMTIGDRQMALVRAETGESGEMWAVDATNTPLASVAKDIGYSLQVIDLEDQTLERPLDGFIRIEPDTPPRIAAATKTPFVLPTAAPHIFYGATDDHALRSVWLTWEAVAADASNRTQPPTKREGRIELCHFPPEKAPRTHEAEYAFDLRSLHVSPGDTLKVLLHASDYRGSAEGVTTDLDAPLIFQVTDIHGIEASMLEADQKSAGTLEAMRRNLIGLGVTP